ncbi:MAG: chromate transporter [Vicinamibacterales bacterium]
MPADSATSDASAVRPSSPIQVFLAFTGLALQGFGGVLAVSERVLCEQKRWLTRKEFVELLALAQVLPGPNICNLAVIVGDRFFGWRGTVAAVGGMMALPLCIVLSLSALYSHFSAIPAVGGALRGMAAVSAGMILGTALRLGAGLRSNVLGVRLAVLAAVASFVAVGVMRWPLVWTLGTFGLACCLLAARWLPPAPDARSEQVDDERE